MTQIGVIVIDTGSDGLPFWHETNLHVTNPALADTDGDGLSGRLEVVIHGTDPILADTVGDRISDVTEVRLGSNLTGFDASSTLSGSVVLAGGLPAAGAEVSVFGMLTSLFAVIPDQRGFFSFQSP